MPTDADAYQRLARALDDHRGDADAYRRLGAQMTARRHTLDPRYGNRRLFVRERLVPAGLKENAAYKLVYDLERGELQGRAGFSAGNILALADAYGTTADEIIAVLDGGDLDTFAPVHRETEAPGGVAVSLERGPDDAFPDLSPEERVLVDARARDIEKLVYKATLDGPLTGDRIFPRSPVEAQRWDTLVAVSQGSPHGELSPWELIRWLAVGRVRDEQRQAGNPPARLRGVLAPG